MPSLLPSTPSSLSSSPSSLSPSSAVSRPSLLQWGRRSTDLNVELEAELQGLYERARHAAPEGELLLAARAVALVARTRHLPEAALAHSVRYTLLVSERVREDAAFRIVRSALEAYRQGRAD